MYDGAETRQGYCCAARRHRSRTHEYEEALFPRALGAAAESARNHGLLFGDDTPHGLLDLLTAESRRVSLPVSSRGLLVSSTSTERDEPNSRSLRHSVDSSVRTNARTCEIWVKDRPATPSSVTPWISGRARSAPLVGEASTIREPIRCTSCGYAAYTELEHRRPGVRPRRGRRDAERVRGDLDECRPIGGRRPAALARSTPAFGQASVRCDARRRTPAVGLEPIDEGPAAGDEATPSFECSVRIRAALASAARSMATVRIRSDRSAGAAFASPTACSTRPDGVRIASPSERRRRAHGGAARPRPDARRCASSGRASRDRASRDGRSHKPMNKPRPAASSATTPRRSTWGRRFAPEKPRAVRI